VDLLGVALGVAVGGATKLVGYVHQISGECLLVPLSSVNIVSLLSTTTICPLVISTNVLFFAWLSMQSFLIAVTRSFVRRRLLRGWWQNTSLSTIFVLFVSFTLGLFIYKVEMVENVECWWRNGDNFSVLLLEVEKTPSTCAWPKKILGMDPSVVCA
jgi:hypothetical protein